MSRPPTTRKPIPKTYLEWSKELAGVEMFLHNVDRLRDQQSEKWIRNMMSYYLQRLEDLNDNKPRKPKVPKRPRPEGQP